MSSAEHTEIWRERFRIDSARREKLHEAMDEYDTTIYIPAVKALQERCEKLGHVRGKLHDNGLGWTWYYCNQCGAAFDKEQHS
jgi:hypothetical protein